MGEEGVETAEAIRAAVVRYVSYNPHALDGSELRPIRSGEAFREDDGTVRIGAWRLEERESGPVLVRGQGVGNERRTVVRLEERGGDWHVTGIDEERANGE
jgi:hypothetical protein